MANDEVNVGVGYFMDGDPGIYIHVNGESVSEAELADVAETIRQMLENGQAKKATQSR